MLSLAFFLKFQDLSEAEDNWELTVDPTSARGRKLEIKEFSPNLIGQICPNKEDCRRDETGPDTRSKFVEKTREKNDETWTTQFGTETTETNFDILNTFTTIVPEATEFLLSGSNEFLTTTEKYPADELDFTTEISGYLVEVQDTTEISEYTTEGQDFTTKTSDNQNFTTETSEYEDFTTETSEGQDFTTESSEDQDFTTESSEDKEITTETSEDQEITTETSVDQDITTETSEDQYFSTETSEDQDFVSGSDKAEYEEITTRSEEDELISESPNFEATTRFSDEVFAQDPVTTEINEGEEMTLYDEDENFTEITSDTTPKTLSLEITTTDAPEDEDDEEEPESIDSRYERKMKNILSFITSSYSLVRPVATYSFIPSH